MKKIIYFSSALIVAFLVFMGIAIVRGAWSEPTVAPPNGNVGAPINVGSLDQSKTGKVSAHDVWSDLANMWMSDIGVQTKILNPGAEIIAPITLAAAGGPDSWHSVIVSTTINGVPLAPTGAVVKALKVRFICGETLVIVSNTAGASPSLSTEPGAYVTYNDPRTVCTANRNRDGVNEVTVPVQALLSGSIPSSYQFFYWFHPTEPPTMHLSAYVVGALYGF